MAQTVSDSVLSALAAAYSGRVSAQGPATLYAAFFIGASTPLSGGSEASGGNYSRIAITNDQVTGFNAPTGSGGSLVVTNKNDITGPRSSASWGTVNCVRLYDASSGGNLVAGAMLSPTVSVDAAGITIILEAGDVSFTIASA